MKKKLIFSTVVIAVITSVAAYTFLLEKKKLSHVPDLNLHVIDGNKLNLNSLKGKSVLVTFWATTCATCVKEIPHLTELYKELDRDDFEIVAIAMPYDPPNRVISMSEKRNIPYPVVLDIQGEAAKAFGNVQVTPSSFLIDSEGNIVEENKGEIDIKALKKKVKTLQKITTSVS